MELTLEERKQLLVDECLLEYTTKPRKWWQSRPDNLYKSTWDVYQVYDYPRVFADEIIIRKNKENAIWVLGACIFFGIIFIVMAITQWNLFGQLISFVIFGAILFISIRDLRDRSPKIIINQEGLKAEKWGFTIPWSDMVVSCLREYSSGESNSHYLRIHLYDPYEDNFKMVECSVDDLEKEPYTIACFVQQFRMDYGKTSQETYQPKA